jgi:hydrogenase maturation protease
MAWSETSPAPHELLDDGFAPEPCELLVIGCGSILRGDDAVGPVLIRTLFTRGVPDGVRLVDGGTAGMDVAFGMRGAARVVIVDASSTGAAPGTVYRVPAEELSELPPIDGLHTHNFRWDHALSFSSWLLGPQKPTDITVFLIEAERFDPGAELTERVAAGMDQVIELLERDFYPPRVEITEAGYLHLPARLAALRFPADVCVARVEDEDLVLMPLASAGHGGLVLKQRNVAGDRSLLVHEVYAFAPVSGSFDVAWDDTRGALRVVGGAARPGPSREGRPADGRTDGDRGPHGGGPGERPLGRLSPDPDAGGARAQATGELHPGVEGPTGRGRGPTNGSPQTTAQERTP